MRNFLLSLLLLPLWSAAQTLASFDVTLPKPTAGVYVPAHVNLDEMSFVKDSSLSLIELIGGRRVPVATQIKPGEPRTMFWLIHDDGRSSVHHYQLVKAAPENITRISADKGDSSMTIRGGGRHLLNYYYKTVMPPKDIDTAYRRSAFIHPLWTPHGQVLTRIQAPDHYHHYGIWNPWTHVLFEKDTIDFWNLNGKKGTVRFSKFTSVENGNVFAEFQALHEHVVFKKDGSEKVALNELQTIRVYQPDASGDYYIMDITSQLNCATNSPVLLLAYRYAGLGWRTTELWDNKNSEVLTSEGKTRKDADGSHARWCIVQGALNNDYGGAVMLSYPSNYNHPEPLRIWPENQFNRGDMFANFAPTKDTDWLLEPGKTYVLKYRFVVFNGKFDKAKAESAWEYFVHPPTIKKTG